MWEGENSQYRILEESDDSDKETDDYHRTSTCPVPRVVGHGMDIVNNQLNNENQDGAIENGAIQNDAILYGAPTYIPLNGAAKNTVSIFALPQNGATENTNPTFALSQNGFVKDNIPTFVITQNGEVINGSPTFFIPKNGAANRNIPNFVLPSDGIDRIGLDSSSSQNIIAKNVAPPIAAPKKRKETFIITPNGIVKSASADFVPSLVNISDTVRQSNDSNKNGCGSFILAPNGIAKSDAETFIVSPKSLALSSAPVFVNPSNNSVPVFVTSSNNVAPMLFNSINSSPELLKSTLNENGTVDIGEVTLKIESDLIRSGVDQFGVDQHGVDQSGVDQSGVDQSGVDQSGVVQSGAVQSHVVKTNDAEICGDAMKVEKCEIIDYDDQNDFFCWADELKEEKMFDDSLKNLNLAHIEVDCKERFNECLYKPDLAADQNCKTSDQSEAGGRGGGDGGVGSNGGVGGVDCDGGGCDAGNVGGAGGEPSREASSNVSEAPPGICYICLLCDFQSVSYLPY